MAGRLFFDSDDALVPHDSSGRKNVYEWEQPGEGSCTIVGGCIYQISDVAGDYDSFFLDADPRGENVFFATEDQLLPSDTDSHVDVYDARVGGGFPVAAASPECDNADSCKPPASPQPAVFNAPGSATFSGPGNPVAAVVRRRHQRKGPRRSQGGKAHEGVEGVLERQVEEEASSCVKQARKKYGVRRRRARKSATTGGQSDEDPIDSKVPVVLALGVTLVLASSAMATFGLQNIGVRVTNQNGSPDVQAGSHPYSITTTFMLNAFPFNKTTRAQEPVGQGDLKEVIARLPPGFVGNPNATPKCKYIEFIHGAECPPDTAIGIDTVYLRTDESPHGGPQEVFSQYSAVFNLEPSPGEPAEFAFMVSHVVPVFLNASVRTGEDYGITVTAPNLSEVLPVFATKVTIWGVPADPSHNALRGEDNGSAGGCVYGAEEIEGEDGLHPQDGAPGSGLGVGEIEQEDPQLYTSAGDCEVHVPIQPLLTNPTSCGVSRTASLTVGAWQEPLSAPILPATDSVTLPPLTGCETLDFSPTIKVTPDGTAGSTPTGLNVDLHVPQESTTNPDGLGEADVKDTTVTLPPGVQISPSASDGLQACSNAQIGFKGVNALSGVDEYTPERPSCPLASKIASVRIKTPLLEEELEGSVYLAAPQNFAGPLENPFGSLVALYLVAEAPVAGVRVKLPGKVVPNPETGQLTTTFENTPALPFSELKLEFYGTDRAPLTTPALCGTYNTESSFVPWSLGEPANPTEIKHPASSFQITSWSSATDHVRCADNTVR